MPGFNYANSVNIEEYINIKDPETKKLLKHFRFVSIRQLKQALTTFILGDVFDKYIDYAARRKEFIKAKKEYDKLQKLKGLIKNATNLTEAQKNEINRITNEYNEKKTALRNSKQGIEQYILQDGSFDFIKAFNERVPKDANFKKQTADQFLKFLALAQYDEERKRLLDWRMKYSISFKDDLTEEQQQDENNRILETADQLASVKKNPPGNNYDKVIDTYQKNNTFEDRLLFAVIHHTKKDVLQNISDDELEKIGMTRKEAGIPEGGELSEEEVYLIDKEFEDLASSIEIRSIDDAKEIIKKIAKIETRLRIEVGKDVKNLEGLFSNEELRDEKAKAFYNSPYYESMSKSLLANFEEAKSKLTDEIKIQISELYKVTNETDLDDVSYLLADDPERRCRSIPKENFTEEFKVKNHEGNYEFKIALKTFDDLYDSAMTEVENSLNYDGKEALKLCEDTLNAGAQNLLDQQWYDEFAVPVARNAEGDQKIAMYQKVQELTNSDKKFMLAENDSIYDDLTDGFRKFQIEEVPHNYGVVPIKEELKATIFTERMAKWQRDLDANPENEEIRNRSIRQEVNEDFAEPAPANNEPHIFNIQDLRWTNKLYPKDRLDFNAGEGIHAAEFLKDIELNHVASNMHICLADFVKADANRLAATIVPDREQEEAYESLNLDQVSNQARLAHYYMYVLATKPEANLNNVLELCNNPELKQEYLEFCKDNSFIGDDIYDSTHVWADIYRDASNKVLQYQLPNIDYSDRDQIFGHLKGLHALRVITENASNLANTMFKQDGIALLENEGASISHINGFMDKIELATRPVSEAYFRLPMKIQAYEVSQLLTKAAARRQLVKERMKAFAGRTLEDVARRLPSKNEMIINNLSDEEYINFYSEDVFYDKDTPYFLADHTTRDLRKKMDNAFKSLEEDKAYAFAGKMNNNLRLFRKAVGEGNSRRRNLATVFFDNDSAEQAIELLNETDERFDIPNVKKYLDEVFGLLFTKDVKEILAANNIDPMDTILINGNTPTELWGAKYAAVQDPVDKTRLIQMEVVKEFIKNDKKIELKAFEIDKDLRLTPNGKFRVNINRADAERIIKGHAVIKKKLAAMSTKLDQFMTRLIDALPEGDGDDRERVLTEGSDVYKAMAQSLKKALDLVKNETSKPSDIRKALDDLQKASDKYYDKRKGIFFGPREGMGTGRLNASDDMRKDVAEMLMAYDNMMKSVDVPYVFGHAFGTALDASEYDMSAETGHIYNVYKGTLGLNYNNVKEMRDTAPTALAMYDEKAKVQVRILNLLKEQNPGVIETDFHTKPSDMVKNKRSMSSYDYANGFMCKMLLEEMYKEDYSADDLKFIEFQIKSGRVKEEIDKISKDNRFKTLVDRDHNNYYKEVNKGNYRLTVIEDIHNNHEVDALQKGYAEIEKRQAKENFDKRYEFINKYDVQNDDTKDVIMYSQYLREQIDELGQRISSKLHVSFGRSAALSMMVYALANEKNENNTRKYSLEDLMDRTKLVDVKKKKFRDIVKFLEEAMDDDHPEVQTEARNSIAKILHEGHKSMAALCDEMASRIDYNNDYFDCTKEFAILTCAGSVQYDCWQEMSKFSDELLALAQAEDPSIEEYEDYKLKTSKMNNPTGIARKPILNLTEKINKIGKPDYIDCLPFEFVGGMLGIGMVKTTLKEWSKEHAASGIGLTEWSIRENATRDCLDSVVGGGNFATEEMDLLRDDAFIHLKDSIIDGTFFRDVRFNKDLEEATSVGLIGATKLTDINAQIQYRSRGDDRIYVEDKVLKNYDAKLKDASDIRKTYINNAKTAVKKLGEYLGYDGVITDSKREVVRNCFKAILSEKFSKVFEEKGFRGNDLKIAVKNATEYMLVHDREIRQFTNKAVMDQMAYEDRAERLVADNENAIFMGEAGVAMVRLLNNNNYVNRPKDLVRDMAYARTAQILRINGRIPKDADTGNEITCRKYFDTLNRSEMFERTLKDVETEQFLPSTTLLNETLQDNDMRKEILLQEKIVKETEQARSFEALEAHYNQAHAAENAQNNAHNNQNAHNNNQNAHHGPHA